MYKLAKDKCISSLINDIVFVITPLSKNDDTVFVIESSFSKILYEEFSEGTTSERLSKIFQNTENAEVARKDIESVFDKLQKHNFLCDSDRKHDSQMRSPEIPKEYHFNLKHIKLQDLLKTAPVFAATGFDAAGTFAESQPAGASVCTSCV
ncbi:MAG: hypothetical protein HY606_10970 [Planctomycetes bacterium]|nr:hypothetical protein [Planctomycetota bacterium]